jgi:Zn-dependent protease with chaperone function
MNFFESQDRARANTTRLVVLFALAVIALIVMTNLLVMVSMGFINADPSGAAPRAFARMDWPVVAAVSLGVGVVVLVGSLYKIMALSAGGKLVAESLGGRLLTRDTTDPKQSRLLNVVEEIAIASSTPAPPVYLLTDEAGINAFAAGFSPRDAVIGVTQGTIDHLGRDELQGVIAHEFSHIFNGDMRLNIRLMGILNGILVLGIIGYYLLRSTSLSGGRRNGGNAGAAMLALGIGLMVIGFAGTFFGGLIKSAVSRQREYLADASAVQFTRNPHGIAGALKRIGGLQPGSLVSNPGASEISHTFFAQGVSGFMQSLSATHPPLAERIRRIEPQWDGSFTPIHEAGPPRDEDTADKAERDTRARMAGHIGAVAAGVAVADVMGAIESMGNPAPESLAQARSLIAQLPQPIRDAAHEPFGARAVIYLLLLDREQAVRETQRQVLQQRADSQVFALLERLLPQMDAVQVRHRLPLLDIVMPALKQLSLDQYNVFRHNVLRLIEVDARVDLLEWSLQKILLGHLDAHFFKAAPVPAVHAGFGSLEDEAAQFLSLLAHAGQSDEADVGRAFDVAARALGLNDLALCARDAISASALDRALEKLIRLQPPAKQRLLKACVASIMVDQHVAPVELELLRAFSAVLECPMPPIAQMHWQG